MITEIYNAITDAIKAIDGVLIKHIDLWNLNVEFIEEDEPWDRPAVFVEFGEIAWEPYKGPVKGINGKGEILLHIVTDWKGSAADGSQHKEETLQDYGCPLQFMRLFMTWKGNTSGLHPWPAP